MSDLRPGQSYDLISGLPSDPPDVVAARSKLAKRFGLPPFSVLNAREGSWQERKSGWIGMGIRSELGRSSESAEGDAAASNGVLMKSLTGADPSFYAKKRAVEARIGRELSAREFAEEFYERIDSPSASGTSIFDPVLCELVYRWWSPAGGLVLDPFAGGSVRGVVAAVLGRSYVGIDLRGEQVESNRAQAKAICFDLPRLPEWIEGDAVAIDSVLPAALRADLVFTCPPYGDLERYSDDPRDLSTMDYDAFVASLRHAIKVSTRRLLDDRFAVVVVGDFRDGRGFYRNFVGDTIRAFLDAGLGLYNEAILVTAVASLSMRAGRSFAAGRKLGKAHQNVLVFVKGDPRKAADAAESFDVEVVAKGNE